MLYILDISPSTNLVLKGYSTTFLKGFHVLVFSMFSSPISPMRQAVIRLPGGGFRAAKKKWDELGLRLMTQVTQDTNGHEM